MLARIICAAVLLLAVFLLCDVYSILPNIFWVRLIAYLAPYIVIGYDILWRAIRSILRGKVFDENFLMALATAGAFATGEYPEAVFVMLFYQVGELFQNIAVAKSRRSIGALLEIREDTAFIEIDGELCEIPCEEIEVGAEIIVKAGGRVPIDGVLLEGQGLLDTSALTGESMPREISVGDEVISGCINLSSVIRIRTTASFEETTVSKILRLVEESAENKSKSEAFITKFARFYTPSVVILAFLLAVIPPIFISVGDIGVWREWIMRAMTFLVISCPCALVISVPLAYFGGVGCASRHGILIKGSNYLDLLAKCEIVVFDKTGTLTRGEFHVTEVCPVNGANGNELLRLAAAAEEYSTHPIAESLCRAAGLDTEAGIGDIYAEQITEIPGRGISAMVCGESLFVGNEKLMRERGCEPHLSDGHGTEVHIMRGGRYLGYILISDIPKENARSALAQLKRLGIRKTVMLTGDREATARAISQKIAIDSHISELLPQEKVSCVERLLKEKKNGTLAFVGDGINDAPVLARSDVGIAMGALGSDAAIESADVVLMNDDLSGISAAITIGRKNRKIVFENIIFSLGVKVAVMLLGAFGIVGLEWAVFADVGVAVIAILNSMRILRYKIQRA